MKPMKIAVVVAVALCAGCLPPAVPPAALLVDTGAGAEMMEAAQDADDCTTEPCPACTSSDWGDFCSILVLGGFSFPSDSKLKGAGSWAIQALGDLGGIGLGMRYMETGFKNDSGERFTAKSPLFLYGWTSFAPAENGGGFYLLCANGSSRVSGLGSNGPRVDAIGAIIGKYFCWETIGGSWWGLTIEGTTLEARRGSLDLGSNSLMVGLYASF